MLNDASMTNIMYDVNINLTEPAMRYPAEETAEKHQRILTEATNRGATILWTDHIFTRFGGLTDAFRDPWGNEVVIWTENIESAPVPEHFTREEPALPKQAG